MISFNYALCRLCLSIITDTNFAVISDVTRKILNVLLVELNFHDENNQIICNACKRKLNAALEFKSMCVYTDNTIIPYAKCGKMLRLDLREIYMKEKGNEQFMDSPYHHKICRLCMQLVKTEFRRIEEEELNAIRKLVPEMNITIIKDPVICIPCFDSVRTHNNFLKDCVEVDKGIANIWNDSTKDTFSLDNITENEIRQIERADVKSADKIISNMQLSEPYSKLKQDIPPVKKKRKRTMRKGTATHQFAHKRLRDEVISRKYRIGTTLYNVSSTRYLDYHLFEHNYSSQRRTYLCHLCLFQTNHETDIKEHLKWHHSLGLKCKLCNYYTPSKSQFNFHQFNHDISSHVYKCADCNYKSKHSYVLVAHRYNKHKIALEQKTQASDSV